MDLAPALLLSPTELTLSKADGVVDDRRTGKQPSVPNGVSCSVQSVGPR